jgi:uncharacterized membrane protein YoaK (UPF0700 family)
MNLIKSNHCVDSDRRFASETPSAGPDTEAPLAINASGFSRMLPPLLSVIAGSADVTSFLGLGLFSAHVTGNLVILTAHIVAREGDKACLALSLPLFVLVLGLTRLLVAGLEAIDIRSLQPLLLLEVLMLSGSFILCLPSHHDRDPLARNIVVAGQLTVAAMAVQNALGQLSSPKAPATAVMTTNLTRFIMDEGEALWGHGPAEKAEARRRANDTWPVIIGFTAGAGLGAACFAAVGPKALALPAGLALLALVMSLAARSQADSKGGLLRRIQERGAKYESS